MSEGGKGFIIDILIKYPKYFNLFKLFLFDKITRLNTTGKKKLIRFIFYICHNSQS
jgi:hypothetical protein